MYEEEQEILDQMIGLWRLELKTDLRHPEPTVKICVVNGHTIFGGDDSFYWKGKFLCDCEKYKNETGKATLTKITLRCLIDVKAHAVQYHYMTGESYPDNMFNYPKNPFRLICRGEYFPVSKEIDMYGVIDTNDDNIYNARISGKLICPMDFELNYNLMKNMFENPAL